MSLHIVILITTKI